MIARILFTCLLAAACATVQAAIEFSSKEEEGSLEGVKFRLLYFKESGKTIGYQPPRGWTVSGGGAGLKMTPPNLSQAQGEISQSPLPAPQLFNEETTKALQEKALASVPQSSEKVALVSEEKSPLKISGKETYGVTIAYSAFGQEFMMNVLFLNLPDTQVCFRTTALKRDFEKVHGAMRGSLLSWQWRQVQVSSSTTASSSTSK
jgi:hypothetical protein